MYWKDAPVIVTCDGEGYPLWGAGKLYRWDGFVVEIFIQNEHRYIYREDDAAIEKLYPELESVISEIKDGIVLSL